MTDFTVKTCPKCAQKLRFPEKIGGVLMACPSCGNKFQSDFKLEGTRKRDHRNILIKFFEMPDKILRCIGRFFAAKKYFHGVSGK